LRERHHRHDLHELDFGPPHPAVRVLRALRGFRRPGRVALALTVALSGGAFVLTSRGDARPAQEEPTAGSAGQFSDTAIVDVNVDVAAGDNAGVIDTLETIQGNVARQLSDLEKANVQVEQAQNRLDAADKVVAKTQAHIDKVTGRSDDVVTTAYVNAPGDSMIDTLTSESATDAAIKAAILNLQADRDAKTLADLERSRDRLEVQRNQQAKAAAKEQQTRSEKEAQLADLQAATSQQTDFVLAVSDRLADQLAEAEALKRVDPEMAAELRSQQRELTAKLQAIIDAAETKKAIEFLKTEQARLAKEEAERLAAEQAAAEAAAAEAASSIGAPSGSLATVTCPAGLGSITVDSSIENALQSMLNAASGDGVNMCGGGWRSPDEQIELRKAHCGTSYYAIYEAPASACSPPTARPGTSMHEQGLAIDFTCNGNGSVSSGDVCFNWLSNNAANYGFHNLPSEPWHWSTSGG